MSAEEECYIDRPDPVVRFGIGQYGHELEVGVLLLPFLRQIQHIQVRQVVGTPIERNRALDVVMEGVLQHGLDRCESGAAGEQENGFFALLAQGKAPQRAFEAENRLFLQLREYHLAETAVHHAANEGAGSGLTFDISSPTFRPFHRKALPSMPSVWGQ